MKLRKALAWLNSGQTLKEYAVKHGKVRPDPENQPVEELHPPKEKPQKRPSSARRRYEKVIDDYKKEQGITFDPTFPEAEPDTARLKVCLDVEINLSVNGQKVQLT
jgi:hypothetical protein